MKKNNLFSKLICSAICVLFFLFIATASDESGNRNIENEDTYEEVEEPSQPSTPTIIDEAPSDYSSDMTEDVREDDEEFVSSATEEDEGESFQSDVEE